MNLMKSRLRTSNGKKIVISVLLLIAIIVSLVPTSNKVLAIAEPNLALNISRTGYPEATASFTYSEYGDSVWNAVNGIYSLDRWSSWMESSNPTDWFAIDFGSVQNFNQVKLYIYNDDGGVKTPGSYNIQYWDGAAWINATQQSKSPEKPYAAKYINGTTTPENILNMVHFDTVSASKLRVEFTNQVGSSSGLVEIEVYCRAEEDIIEASAVETLIGLLPLEAAMSLSDRPAIEAARAAYEALTESQKSIVSNLSGLTAAEAGIIALEADTTPPTGSFLINNGAFATNNTSVSLHFNFYDNLTETGEVSLSLDGVTWGDWQTAKTILINLPYGDGTKTLSAKFRDGAGNVSAIVTQSIMLDTTAPVIALDSYDGTTPTNNDITVRATTNEGTLNVESHTFTDNGTFDFIATDAAGNITTQTVTITNIDKVAPITTVTIMINSTTKYVTINLNAIDNGTDIVTNYYTVDGVQQTGNLIFLNKQGAHLITYWSVDAAGNVESLNSKEVKVEILQMDSNGQFDIVDIVKLIQYGTLLQQDMNGDGIFDREDLRIMLGEITPISFK